MTTLQSLADEALLQLLQALKDAGYHFVTPTPSTGRRMVERARPGRRNLRDVFGWSLPFTEDDLSPDLLRRLETGGGVTRTSEGLKSRYRVSTVRGRLFLHSAFPANARDAVFLGPDTYRFADLLARELANGPTVRTLFDIGAGAGVGGIVAGGLCPGAEIWLGDVNDEALRLARINAAHADLPARVIRSRGLEGAPASLDLVVANPPYVAGESGRTYKDGGDLHGGRLSLDWAKAAMARLAPGGRMILYTGSAILDGGIDQLGRALAQAADEAGCGLRYAELDPDIFPGELRRDAYRDVERIAAVSAVLTRPS